MSNSSLINMTVLSPNHSGKRKHDITRLTIHCTACLVSASRLGDIFLPKKKNASCNYGIGTDGKIVLIVPEDCRSWCSSSNDNDQRAVTIEAASQGVKPYQFAPGVYEKCLDLATDICKRNGKKKLLYIADKALALKYQPKDDEMVMTFHRWFSLTKSCPGDWFMSRAKSFAEEVTKRLDPTPQPAEYHTVKHGENLTKIRKKYGLTEAEILALNPWITNKNLIKPNQLVRVR